MNLQIQLTEANCKECIESVKNLKSVIPSTEIASLDPMAELNQEIQVDFLGPMQPTWPAKKYLLICVDHFFALTGGGYKRIPEKL